MLGLGGHEQGLDEEEEENVFSLYDQLFEKYLANKFERDE